MRHFLYRAQFNLAPYITTKFPTHIDIELAAKCNLRCTMCPYGDNGDGPGSFDESRQGMMCLSMAKEAIFQAKQGGAKSIKFNFRGEPGMSRHLEECVKYANELGFVELAINTNLLAFSQRRLDKLCNAGLNLMIVSIDGATKEVYESIRINGDFDKLLSNLAYVAHREKRPRIRLQMVLQKGNAEEKRAFKERFKEYADEIIFQKERSLNVGERKRCPQPWQRLIVGWNGRVFACCSQWEKEYPVGLFPYRSLQETWDGHRLKVLRIKAINFNGRPCKNCKVGVSYK